MLFRPFLLRAWNASPFLGQSFHIVPPFRQQSTSSKDDKNGVLLKMCFTPADVKDNDMRLFDPKRSSDKYLPSDGTFTDIKKKALDMFDTIENLEYYDAEHHTWYPINEITKEKGVLASYKGRVLPIRIPDFFDDFEIGDMHDDPYNDFFGDMDDHQDLMFNDINFAHDNDDNDSAKNRNLDRYGGLRLGNVNDQPEHVMERTIRELQNQLRQRGYVRSNTSAMTLHNTQSNDEIVTKQWVLQECKTSTGLRSAVLESANALSHIVQCLHYDFLWKGKK